MLKRALRKAAVLAPFAALGSLFAAHIASAHEAYLLDHDYFWHEMNAPWSPHAFEAFTNPHNVLIGVSVAAGVIALLFVNLLFRKTGVGRRLHAAIERLAPIGPLFVRLAIAASFWFSAATGSFLGPELRLADMPFGGLIRIGLYVASVLIALGLFTEFAGLLALAMFSIGFFAFGGYLVSYLNYFGEVVVLLLFGMRTWSLDRWIFGRASFLEKWKKYDTTIVRVCYGFALAYAAITVKFLHPDLTVTVVNKWNLTQFHWLFPGDPLLVTLGAAICEFVIGLFIIFGFELRLTVFISLFYLTLSLLYFREAVWPHLMLYGISLNLLVQPEIFTLDHLISKKNWPRLWRRPLVPHAVSD